MKVYIVNIPLYRMGTEIISGLYKNYTQEKRKKGKEALNGGHQTYTSIQRLEGVTDGDVCILLDDKLVGDYDPVQFEQQLKSFMDSHKVVLPPTDLGSGHFFSEQKLVLSPHAICYLQVKDCVGVWNALMVALIDMGYTHIEGSMPGVCIDSVHYMSSLVTSNSPVKIVVHEMKRSSLMGSIERTLTYVGGECSIETPRI